MRILTTLTLCCILFLSGCTTISRFHSQIVAGGTRDAENSLTITAKAGGNPALERCAIATLAVLKMAPDPALVVGPLSKKAAWQAYEKLYRDLRVACAESEIESRGKLARLLQMFGGVPFGF